VKIQQCGSFEVNSEGHVPISAIPTGRRRPCWISGFGQIAYFSTFLGSSCENPTTWVI